jgi:hypothetical protein
MAREKFVITRQLPVETEDGELTPYGMRVAEAYASQWCEDWTRDLVLEETFPELTGFFQDIRTDAQLAFQHAQPVED